MSTNVGPRRSGIVGSPVFVMLVAALLVAAGVAAGTIRFVGGLPVERGLEGALGAAAFGAVLAAAGILALLALADRPVLLLPAACILIPLSLLSFSGILLPLLVPAVLLFAAYRQRSAGVPGTGPWIAGTVVVVLVLLVAAVVVLFVHEDPRSYVAPGNDCVVEMDGSSTRVSCAPPAPGSAPSRGAVASSTSDVITYAESLTSLALAAAAVAFGWFSAPRATPPRDSDVRRPQLLWSTRCGNGDEGQSYLRAE